jgi:dolichol kinase
VVTFADAFAAIVGTRCGKKHYGILGAYKSVEGTATFLVTAFVSLFIVVSFATDHQLVGAVLISVVVAVASTVAELFSGRDLDNLTVPAVVFCFLYYLI